MIKAYKNVCLLFLFILIAPLSIVNAELPPGTYEELKSNASEYIKIEILNVVTEDNTTNCKIEVKYLVKILEIFRSNSSLQIGDEILIHSYNIQNTPSCDGFSGPRIPELLVSEWVGNAYINPISNLDNEFDIAAYGESFEESKTENSDSKDSGCFISCF